LAAIVLLNITIIWGLGRLALGLTEAGLPILVNVFWACYDLVALSIVLRAATYHPDVTDSPLPTEPATTMAEFHGRPGAGQA
jgi:hypothetical protein